MDKLKLKKESVFDEIKEYSENLKNEHLSRKTDPSPVKTTMDTVLKGECQSHLNPPPKTACSSEKHYNTPNREKETVVSPDSFLTIYVEDDNQE